MFPTLPPSSTSPGRGLRLPSSSSSSSSQQEQNEINTIVKDLEEVRKIWERIEALLADAEERQIRVKSVHLWLRDLKDLADQIVCLRDVIEYEVVARQVQASKASSSSGGASTPMWRRPDERPFEVRPSETNRSLSPLADASFREQIAARIREIRGDFRLIATRREILHLKEMDGTKYSFAEGTVRRQPTGSFVQDPVFLGRDQVLQRVRDLLIADHRGGPMNVEVIAVVGMGGIGKTTVAQHVSKDPQVVGSFDKIIWVHVSEDFDVIRLAKAIVETLSGTDCRLSELSSLQIKALQLVTDKKVLLVMDDIWSIHKKDWESLIAPLHSGARKGSKILVTTRLQEVANGAGAVESIKLGRLSREDGWSLLKKHALLNESNDVGNLEGIGKRIVERCGGLPLSIKLLGSLLRGRENDENEWNSVMESDLLDFNQGKEILGSLYLSYLYLSPKLKSCFKFCATYPKGGIFEEHLKQSWMAYDLVNDEEEATKCLNELLARSFLEGRGSSSYSFLNISIIGLCMHDHIYDLAKYALGEERVNLECDGASPQQLNEAHFAGAQHASIIFRCHKAKSHSRITNTSLSNVRTLELKELLPAARGSIPAWVSQLYNLRYLSLCELKENCSLDCVCDLRNLRWLIVEYSEISSLPNSISELLKLRVLSIYECRGLKALPESIVKLANLRMLKAKFCDLPWMPSGIGALTKLETLTFPVSTRYAGLAELKNMRYLRNVKIENLCDEVTEKDAERAQLDTKNFIRELFLDWKEHRREGDFIREPFIQRREHAREERFVHEEQVLKRLRPHHNIERLHIRGYKGSMLPSWMGHESFTRLVFLDLSFVNYCTSLSPIHELPSLEELVLFGMESLEEVFPPYQTNIGHDIGIMHFFPKLKHLTIKFCKSLKFLPLHKFSSLEVVSVSSCMNLRSMEPPYGIHCSLKKIVISRCPNFRFLPDPHFPQPSWKLDLDY